MNEPLTILDLKTIKTNFYEIHLYEQKVEYATNKNKVLEALNNKKINYSVEFLNKEISYEEDECISLNAEMYIFVMEENKLILKLKINCSFIICFKNTFRLSNDKKNLNNIYLPIGFSKNPKKKNIIDCEIYDGINDVLIYYENSILES